MKILNYNHFLILESLSQAKNVIAQYNITDDNKDFLSIKDKLDPNYGYLPLFCKFKFRDKISTNRIFELIDLIHNYNQLLSNNKIAPLTYDSFEKLDDDINKAIINNEDIKFAKSFISNKYKHLLDDVNIKLFGELRSYEKSHERIQSLLTKKLLGFKTPGELTIALKALIGAYSGAFEPDAMEIKVIENGGIVVYKDENCLIAHIPDYKACSKLGSSAWCITREASYFNSYASAKSFKRQFIYWDFTKSIHDRESQIGITLDISNTVTACHDKSDYSYHDFKHIVELIPKIDTKVILDMIKNGSRFSKAIRNKFKISDEDILEVNPMYFFKLSDIDDENELINYISNNEPKPYEYGKLLNNLLDEKKDDLVYKLLDIKFSKAVLNRIDLNRVKNNKILSYIDVINTALSKLEDKEDYEKLFSEIDIYIKFAGFKNSTLPYHLINIFKKGDFLYIIVNIALIFKNNGINVTIDPHIAKNVHHTDNVTISVIYNPDNIKIFKNILSSNDFVSNNITKIAPFITEEVILLTYYTSSTLITYLESYLTNGGVYSYKIGKIIEKDGSYLIRSMDRKFNFCELILDTCDEKTIISFFKNYFGDVIYGARGSKQIESFYKKVIEKFDLDVLLKLYRYANKTTEVLKLYGELFINLDKSVFKGKITLDDVNRCIKVYNLSLA